MVINRESRKKANQILQHWLNDETLIELLRELVFNDRLTKGTISHKILDDPAEFLISYFGTDLLSKDTIRRELVMALRNEADGYQNLVELCKQLKGDFTPLPEDNDKRITIASIGKWVRGGPSATTFAKFFSFPDDFAGTRRSKYQLLPLEEIMARREFPPLHEYQNVLLKDMQDWFSEPTFGDDSAILVLPTGTGKTRVAVELIIDDLKRSLRSTGNVKHIVLWVAHTKELCEQALESMRKMWMMQGAEGEYLNIYRFWESIQPGSLISARGIVVAGIQKLNSALNQQDQMIILKNYVRPRVRMIVIDEVHLADNPSYRKVLDFFWDRDEDGSKRIQRQWKLLGLTATPFKSDEKRTKTLEGMFPKRFDLRGRDDPRLTGINEMGVYKWMQTNRYLSNPIEYQPIFLPKNEFFIFARSEMRHIRKFNDLNDTVLKRLSIQMERNECILEKVRWAIDNGSRKILLFACSVPHCYLLSSMFSENGIQSLFVTGEMGKQERAESINTFKSHPKDKPIVLINYAILTTGFDDPSIDTIFIARPTCSRVLYQQMIGRGLRGVKNGGNKDGRCLIMDIKDNFTTFQGFQGVTDFNEESTHLM